MRIVYGLITRLTAQSGQREALAQLLAGGLGHRAGCLSYVVALDTTSADDLWVTEVWVDETAHRDSLIDPMVKAFGVRIWPMVVRLHDPVITEPLSGSGAL